MANESPTELAPLLIRASAGTGKNLSIDWTFTASASPRCTG
jgi:hypothetical protein